MSPSACAQACSQLPSPHLVGFWYVMKDMRCQCFYSGKNIPTPPSGLEWNFLDSKPTGTGPIQSSSNGNYPGECYAFPQVREIFYFHPQVSWSFNISNVVVQGTGNPTGSPSLSPSSPTFEKVGDGVCVDASDNTYSIVWELGTAITSAEACGNWCLQHPEPNFVGFTSPKSTTHGCICHFSGALVTPKKDYTNPIGYHQDPYTGFGAISGVTNFTALPSNASNPVDVSDRECFRYKVC